jgi:hypothetical protein
LGLDERLIEIKVPANRLRDPRLKLDSAANQPAGVALDAHGIAPRRSRA